MGFQQGLSGLSASSKSLEVIGNNVANANTYGAKSSRAEFADTYAATLGGGGLAKPGFGVRVAAISQQFSQGNLTATSNPLDVAINGDGFFMVQRWDPIEGTETLRSAGERLYTRNGQFKFDADGYVVNNEGNRLLGVDTKPLRVNLSGGGARATNEIAMELNLDAGKAVDTDFGPPDVTTGAVPYPPLPNTYSFSTAQTLYDESGEPVSLEYYFNKISADAWDIHVAADGNYLTPGVASYTVTFDPSGRGPTSIVDSNANTYPDAAAIPPTDLNTIPLPTIPGNNTLSAIGGVKLNLSGLTQFASISTVEKLTQNGYPKGDFSSFQIDPSGSILVRFTNGITESGGQIGLARFTNSLGLQPVGGNQWRETEAAGEAVVDKPGSGRFGLLQGGALEDSNVDLTAELVNMIVAQRSYQANAQTIKTEDQVLQTLVNLR